MAAGLAKDPAARPADGAALVAGLRAVAGSAYGPDWEDRGRSALAAAALLLAALWPSGGPAALSPSGGPAAAHGSTVHRIRLRAPHQPHRRISMVKAAIAVAVVAAGTVLALVVSHRSTSPAANTPVLTGTWTGSYICSQGLTGLRLVVRAAPDGTLTGTFSFYALPANPACPLRRGHDHRHLLRDQDGHQAGPLDQAGSRVRPGGPRGRPARG